MKKIIAWLLVLTLTAAVSIGATLAYLTDTDEDVNVMTLGKVKIDQLEFERIDDETENEAAKVQDFRDNKPLYPAVTEKGFDYTPGDSNVDWKQIGKDGYTSEIWDPSKINNEIDKMVFVKNKGDYDAFVRCVMAFEAAPGWSFADFKTKVHLNLNDTEWTWQWIETPVSIGEGTYFVAVATYNGVLKPGALTEISLSQIALDKTATNQDMKALGETYNVLVKSQGIQADGFETAAVALDEGFGKITVANIPWESDSPFKGIDLYTALHFLDGKSTDITANVTGVIFGRNSAYPQTVDTYDGVLVDVEQDIPAYAYYVPNGSNYDLYILSDGVTYAPKDSTSLFAGMSSLAKMDTGNLDVSRMEIADRLFHSCAKLSALDVSKWNTGRITSANNMFFNCTALKTLDVSKWDTSSVQNFRSMFGSCSGLTALDVSNWDVSNATNMSFMFWKNGALKALDLSKWNVGNVETMERMFMSCAALETLGDTNNWNTSKVTNMSLLFSGCSKLTTIGVRNWDVSKVTNMQQTFYNCQKLVEVDVSKWNTCNVETMRHMFQNCISLTKLDLKNWKTGKVKDFASMFSSNTSNAGNMKFAKLEVENWDTSSATDISYMFYGCGYITDLDLSKWDVSNVTTLVHTFADCFDMVNYNFTGWDTSSVTTMDGIFNSNLALQVIDLSAFDTQNIQDFDQTFDGCSELIQVIGMDRWDTSSLKYVQQFLTGTKVTVMDLSSFDMTNATHTWMMFSGNPELTTIYASENWNLNPAQLKNAGNMFGGCGKLTGANGTTTAGNPTDATYARIDLPAVKDAEGNVITEAVPGYLTYKAAPVTP